MCYTTESYEDDISVLRQINPNIIALDEKTLEAERRSYHTFFDVHVVETADGYILIEEGDYGELPMHLIVSGGVTPPCGSDAQRRVSAP